MAYFPKTAEEAGRNWAKAYADMALKHRSPLGFGLVPASVRAAQLVLGRSLMAAYLSFDPVSTAAMIATAYTSFWLLPTPMPFLGTPPGVVTAVLGTSILQASLIANWPVNVAARITVDQAAQQMAQLIEALCHTVIVTHLTTPPTIGPLI